MRNRLFFLLLYSGFTSSGVCENTGLAIPTHLTTDLLEYTGMVMQDGLSSSISLEDIDKAIESIQFPEIRTSTPTFGWIINSNKPNTIQTSYRILVATSKDRIKEEQADIWDSGTIYDSNSSSVRYSGHPLAPGQLYYWTVQISDNHGGISGFAVPKAFRTADILNDNISIYPLEASIDFPSRMTITDGKINFFEFDKTAFGTLIINIDTDQPNDSVIIRIGEKSEGERVWFKPEDSKSSIRSDKYKLALRKGTHTYILKIMPDKRNTDTSGRNESGVAPVLMPKHTGEVLPFRFCEIEPVSGNPTVQSVSRKSIHYPFDNKGADFESSDTTLNIVWDLCRNSIEATTFCGIYVDGDRERIAYEADAVIGQLGHYSTDREFSMARASLQHLIDNPTWPTEWQLQIPIIAWNDYMYTGDSRMLKKNYDVIKAKTLLELRSDNGLISTRNITDTAKFHKSINFRGKRLKDIVDWPQNGYIGEEKERPGEADGYVRKPHNTVVNAYHYNALSLMSRIARVLGYKEDEDYFNKESELFKKNFNTLLFNDSTGHYRDGLETDDESLHGNMMPLAFGLVEEEHKAGVLDFIKQRRMACSVYGAQFLLDALYSVNEGEYALKLLSSTGERSWYNMHRAGSTITMEAWDDKYKPNQDWNHAWGSAPANIIPRGLFGIHPTEPGFDRFSIKPQPSDLEYARLRLPTIKGDIKIEFHNRPGKSFTMDVEIPANSQADVSVPTEGQNNTLIIDGKKQKFQICNGFISFPLHSGHHNIEMPRGDA